MPLTRPVVVKRIEDLKQNVEQLKAQLNMVTGALADAEWVLTQVDTPEPPAEE